MDDPSFPSRSVFFTFDSELSRIAVKKREAGFWAHLKLLNQTLCGQGAGICIL